MFRCALIEGEMLEVSITSDGSRYIAQVPIGTDDETGHRYSVFVALQMVVGYGADTKELVFCILEADPQADWVEDIWDGRVLRRTIAETAHRKAILGVVCQLALALVDEARPHVVTMMTHEAGLPPKALVKYQRIVSIFGTAGYKVGKFDVWHGQHIWAMERW